VEIEMRSAAAWTLVVASWLVGVDSMVRALWNWAKLGSFGYHVPWSLVATLAIAGLASASLFRSDQFRAVAAAFFPFILVLIARHW
jgi:hypothetical protein